MDKATNSPGPVSGHPYAVIVITGGFDVQRFSYPAPVDALIAAIGYLRDGRQARLTDRTVAALREVPETLLLDRVTADVPALAPVAAMFKAADRG